MKRLRQSEGFLLISSYMVISTLMILTLSICWRSFGFFFNSERSIYQVEAFHLAESGLDDAIVRLESDLSYAGNTDISYEKNGRVIGTYSTYVETPDGTNPYRKKITATGTTADVGGDGRTIMTRSIVAYIELIPRQTFEFAMFADKGITMSGSPTVYVDSYDSKNGTYDLMSALANADIATNSTAADAVLLEGNVNILGDVTVGVGGDPSTAVTIGPNSSVSGTLGSATNSRSYDPVLVPNSAVSMGDISLDANTKMQLEGGTYIFDSLNISGKATLTFTGPATVYLKGDAYIAGNGVATVDNRAKNLVFHVQGVRSLAYAGNAQFYAGIYAPESLVDVSGNGEVFGAVIANTYSQSGGGKFHFDEDLKDVDPNDELRAEIVSWQEQDKYFGA